MAGSIPLSLTQQFDRYGMPLNGGIMYFIQAGTTQTPQNAFQDSALTIPWPNPLTLDASGRVGQLFFADGAIKVRLTDRNGVTQLVADNIQVIGPSGGGGGGGSVDPTTIWQTGDLKPRYGTGVHTGFVRANGRTIGSATSGATERANADTQQLFEYLWGADANLAVSSGRGASANADFVANKTIALPDWRGYALAALDDMGNSASGRLTASYFGSVATVLGAVGGSEARSLAAGNLAPHTHSGTTAAENAAHNHSGVIVSGGGTTTGGGGFPAIGSLNGGTSGTENQNHGHDFTSNGGNGLAGSAFAAIGPRKLATIYLKL
ncbi:hypothetical protein [Tardiphaga sp. P5_C7]